MFDKLVAEVAKKLNKNVEEVSSVLKQMGSVDFNDEDDVYVWIVESNDCLLDEDVVEEYETVLEEVCDELNIEFIC